MKSSENPYQILGERIKNFRKQWHQTLDEVSNTLEIEKSMLKSIESGSTLPPEDVLDLIINHFLLTDEQADELRTLADMNAVSGPDSLFGNMEEALMKQIVMFMPIDNKIIYTDGMNVSVNHHGVTLQFTQSTPGKTPAIVSQVGMSREHAEKAIEVLKRTIQEHDKGKQTKLLPPGNNTSKTE